MASPTELLSALDPHALTLHKITTPLTDPTTQPTPTPTALTSELTHYRSLFSALRFNYLEQVTKEKFLRGIVEEPSLVVEAEENAQLETEVLGKKQVLQENKRHVETLLKELEDTGRRVVDLYDQWKKGKEELGKLPGEIAKMEEEGNSIGEVGMGLGETVEVLRGVREELEGLRRELKKVEEELPVRRKELVRLEGEVRVEEGEKDGLERFVEGALRERERREREGKGEREAAGMWYKGSYEVLSGLLADD